MSNDLQEQIDSLAKKIPMLYEGHRYDEGINALLSICDMNVKIGKKEHPENAISLAWLAIFYESVNDYVKSESTYIQALDIFYTILGGRDTPDEFLVSSMLDTQNRLAQLYATTGNYNRAETFYLRSLEILRKLYGNNHPDFASGLYQLALLYRNMGYYNKAEKLFLQTILIQKRVLNENDPKFASSLNSLGVLYFNLGSYDKARCLYLQALAVWRKANMENTAAYAACLNNLGVIYRRLGRDDKAEPCLLRSLNIRRKVLGNDNIEVAQGLTNLASLYSDSRRPNQAESLFLEALTIWRKANVENTVDSAACMVSLGVLYYHKGDYQKAEPLYLKGLEINRNLFGEGNTRNITDMRNLAMLYAAQGRMDDSFDLVRKVIEIEDKRISEVFSMASEAERISFIKTLQKSHDLIMSIVFQSFQDSNNAIRYAMDLVLKRKAISAEVSYDQRDLILHTLPSLRPKLQQLNELHKQISEDSLAIPESKDVGAYEHNINRLVEKKERLEKELSISISEAISDKRLKRINTEAVASGLPAQSILVEYVRFGNLDFHHTYFADSIEQSTERYVAFVLPSGKPDKVLLLDIGEADMIDKMINAFRGSIINDELEARGEQDYIDLQKALPKLMEVTGSSDVVSVEFIEEAQSMDNGNDLRSLLFNKFSAALEGRRRIIISPDGDISKLPFEVLPIDDKNGHLIDRYDITYLSTGRDILRFNIVPLILPSEPLVIGDPDFNLGTPPANNPDLLPFKRLEGTREEANKIGAMLKVDPLLDGSALESTVKKCQSPHIIHICTHGFFFPNQQNKVMNYQKGTTTEEENVQGSSLTETVSRWQTLENPMLRSGLALAGANTRLLGGTLPKDAEDGLLTAEDVCTVDLSSTELAVLSACETGLGSVLTGEGVFGLRRAFVLAGAQTLVMSLWKVPDEHTKELMVEFYQRVLNGEPRSEALREAQLMMKKKYKKPFYWGAFVCQGNFGPMNPLSKITPQTRVGHAVIIHNEGDDPKDVDPAMLEMLSRIQEIA